jgi:hypothetical protein
MASTLEANLAAATAAVKFVKDKKLKASNKVSDRIAAAGGIDKVVGTNQGTGTLGPAGSGVRATRKVGLRLCLANLGSRADHYVNKGFGNCQEQAEIALWWLYKNNASIRPLSLMSFNAKGYDHVWVVVGLAKGWQDENLRSWGTAAVWCDPWQGDGIAFPITDFIKGSVRNLNAIYKCNTVERVEAGQVGVDLQID